MTTTVRDLLDRLHQQAWTLVGPTSDDSDAPANPAMIRRAWMPLARHTTRALQNLPFAPQSHQRHYARVITDTLEPLRAKPQFAGNAQHPGLVDMSRVIGTIADLIASPAQIVDDDGATGLQASVLAAVYGAARWSVPRMDIGPKNRPNRAIGAMHRILVLTEPLAALPPGQRSADLEDLAAVRTSAPGLDAALVRWRRVVDDQLANRYTLTTNGFQTIAADLAILTAAAVVSVRSAGPTALAVPELHQRALDALLPAQRSWSRLSTWPEGVHLGGRTSGDLRAASRDLRAEVRALLRTDDNWATPAQLWQRTTPDDLLALTRRTITTAAGTGAVYADVLIDHTTGRGRPWIKAETVPHPHRDAFINHAAANDGWTPIPETILTGPHTQLAYDAHIARIRTYAARDALRATNGVATQRPAPDISIESGRLVLLEHARWEQVPPNAAPAASRALVGSAVACAPSHRNGPTP